jgi:putative transposase
LKKLGVTLPSKNTLKRILKAKGLDPAPKRGRDTWDDFLKRHARSLWQYDFTTRRVMTVTGMRDTFVLVFFLVKSRQVMLSPATRMPNETWVAEQAERFVRVARGRGLKVRHVQRDRDTKFVPTFDGRLKRKRVKVIRNQVRSPNTNAFVERFIQTIQHECIDRFLIFGETHLDHLCAEFVAHYYEDRPQQSLGNEPVLKLKRRPADPTLNAESPTLGEIRYQTRLGGLLKSYSRKAA